MSFANRLGHDFVFGRHRRCSGHFPAGPGLWNAVAKFLEITTAEEESLLTISSSLNDSATKEAMTLLLQVTQIMIYAE